MSDGIKSAWETALERLDEQGIDRPRDEAYDDKTREAMEDIRQRAEARIAELRIMNEKAKADDPANSPALDQELRVEIDRVESKRDRDLENLRES